MIKYIDSSINIIAISKYLTSYFRQKKYNVVNIPAILDVENAGDDKSSKSEKTILMYAGSVGRKDKMISGESFNRRRILFKINYTHPLSGLSDYPSVRIWDDNQSRAYAWLDENFGEEWIWSSSYQNDYTDIYFLRPEDAIIFKLKFSTIKKIKF